jgi:protein-tyrosine-phosphatase
MVLQGRGDAEDEGAEATRCFLRAMLAGIGEDQEVPGALVGRIADLLRIDVLALSTHESSGASRASSRPAAPRASTDKRKVLVVGRGDGERLPLCEGVARSMLDDAVVRAACASPINYDPRALKALRQAGYATDGLLSRPLSVDDLAWAELVLTVGGDRAYWERTLPRSTPREHLVVDEPQALADELDDLESFRVTLRQVERSIAPLRNLRPSRVPSRMPPPIRRTSSSTMRAVVAGTDDERDGEKSS